MAEPTLLASVLASLSLQHPGIQRRRWADPLPCTLCEGGWLLTVENRAHLTPEDIRHMRDPFWRKDAARSGIMTTHAGLGLGLVDSFCRLMNVRVTSICITPRQTFVLRLISPAARANFACRRMTHHGDSSPPVGYASQATDRRERSALCSIYTSLAGRRP
jgi:hypothetical protein